MPEPEGPVITTNSPRLISSEALSTRVDRNLAFEPPRQLFRLEDDVRHEPRRISAGTHARALARRQEGREQGGEEREGGGDRELRPAPVDGQRHRIGASRDI